jgi:hypothetical protein
VYDLSSDGGHSTFKKNYDDFIRAIGVYKIEHLEGDERF